MARLQPQLDAPLVFDPATKLFWYTDLPLLVGTYRRQSEVISTIHIHGFSHLRFASKQEVTSLMLADASDAFL